MMKEANFKNEIKQETEHVAETFLRNFSMKIYDIYKDIYIIYYICI